MKSLVVPLDGSALSERAVPLAASLAERSGAAVVVVRVPTWSLDGEEAAYVDRVSGLFHVPVTYRHVDLGAEVSVAGAIVGEAAAAPDAVVVMSTHGRSAVGEVLFGSVAGDVLRGASVPVVLVGPRCRPGADLGGRFVVAVDGSCADAGLVDAAAKWADSTSAVPAVVHVVVPSELEARAEGGATDGVARRAAEALWRRGCLATEATVVSADAASGVLAFATDQIASAVLVGHHRRGSLDRLVLGSQALGIVHQARYPVVVVPRPDP